VDGGTWGREGTEFAIGGGRRGGEGGETLGNGGVGGEDFFPGGDEGSGLRCIQDGILRRTEQSRLKKKENSVKEGKDH